MAKIPSRATRKPTSRLSDFEATKSGRLRGVRQFAAFRLPDRRRSTEWDIGTPDSLRLPALACTCLHLSLEFQVTRLPDNLRHPDLSFPDKG